MRTACLVSDGVHPPSASASASSPDLGLCSSCRVGEECSGGWCVLLCAPTYLRESQVGYRDFFFSFFRRTLGRRGGLEHGNSVSQSFSHSVTTHSLLTHD